MENMVINPAGFWGCPLKFQTNQLNVINHPIHQAMTGGHLSFSQSQVPSRKKPVILQFGRYIHL